METEGLSVERVGEAVRRGRLAAGLDQRDLAAGLGVSPMTLRRLESGQGSSLALALAALQRVGAHVDIKSPGVVDRRRAPSPTRTGVVLERNEERVQFELHRAVARRLRTNPAAVVTKARANLDRVRQNVSGPRARAWVEDWARALDGPLSALIELCLRQDEYGIDMRQVSPFAGVLTTDERMAAIRAGRAR